MYDSQHVILKFTFVFAWFTHFVVWYRLQVLNLLTECRSNRTWLQLNSAIDIIRQILLFRVNSKNERQMKFAQFESTQPDYDIWIRRQDRWTVEFQICARMKWNWKIFLLHDSWSDFLFWLLLPKVNFWLLLQVVFVCIYSFTRWWCSQDKFQVSQFPFQQILCHHLIEKSKKKIEFVVLVEMIYWSLRYQKSWRLTSSQTVLIYIEKSQ